jgi:hypothetical protein
VPGLARSRLPASDGTKARTRGFSHRSRCATRLRPVIGHDQRLRHEEREDQEACWPQPDTGRRTRSTAASTFANDLDATLSVTGRRSRLPDHLNQDCRPQNSRRSEHVNAGLSTAVPSTSIKEVQLDTMRAKAWRRSGLSTRRSRYVAATIVLLVMSVGATGGVAVNAETQRWTGLSSDEVGVDACVQAAEAERPDSWVCVGDELTATNFDSDGVAVTSTRNVAGESTYEFEDLSVR